MAQLASIRQMSRQVSRGSGGQYQVPGISTEDIPGSLTLAEAACSPN